MAHLIAKNVLQMRLPVSKNLFREKALFSKHIRLLSGEKGRVNPMKLSVEQGTFAYRPQSPVLNELSFSVESGDLLAILGPNGAGKTTLLRCMMGFLRWNSGRSVLDGVDLRAIPTRSLWQKLAYVPQARGAATAFTAEEAVLLGRSSRIGTFGQPGAADFRAAEAVMEQLGILRLRNRSCAELSGGELQMVLIARALASEPQVLILDEPESNLDFQNQLIVLDTMSALAARGMTCVFNTHYPAHALQRANKALLLRRGGSGLFGETGRVVTEANIAEAFHVRAVIGELETPGSTVRTVVPLKVLPDMPPQPMTEAQRNTARTLAVISVILQDVTQAEPINTLLHEYSRYLVGRMGMPYRAAAVHIINVTLDAPLYEIESLSAKLSILPGVCAKTTYAPAPPKWREP